MWISAGSLFNCLQTYINSNRAGNRKFAFPRRRLGFKTTISLHLFNRYCRNMVSDFKLSDTLSEAFSLTVFRTSGYTSECFTIVLAAACKFWSHICPRTKHLVLSSEGVLMRTFPELVLRTTLTWRPFLGRLSMFSNWSRLWWLSFSEIFLSWPNIKVFHEDFQVVFLIGEETWTDLRKGLFPSGVSSKCFFAGVDFKGVLVALPTSPCSNSFTI